MSTKRDQYICEVFASETQLLKDVRVKMKAHQVEGVNLSPIEACVLKTLLSIANAKKIVEIGLLHGYSALWMADILPEEGHLYSLEKDSQRFQIANENISQSPLKNKITCLLGDAVTSLEVISSEGPFDAVFIDANKGGYCQYLDWAENHVKKGGLIIGDNSLLFGYVYGEGDPNIKVGKNPIKVMQEFNQRLSDSSKYQSCLIPTGSGLTVAKKLF